MKFSEFESERLIFRKFSEDDFPVMYSWHRDAENMGFRRDGVKTEEETREFLHSIIADANEDECENFWFAVVRKTDGKLIGDGILFHIGNWPEIGWLVDKKYWRQGYGGEIGRALLKYGFETVKLHRIIAACHADNHASRKLIEGLRMRREAHFIKAQLHNGVWGDRYQYAILREEWEKYVVG